MGSPRRFYRKCQRRIDSARRSQQAGANLNGSGVALTPVPSNCFPRYLFDGMTNVGPQNLSDLSAKCPVINQKCAHPGFSAWGLTSSVHIGHTLERAL